MANEHQTMEENALSLNTGNCHLRELKQLKVFILCYSFRHVSQRLQLSVTVLLKSRAMHYSSERVKIERTEQLSVFAFFQHFFLISGFSEILMIHLTDYSSAFELVNFVCVEVK